MREILFRGKRLDNGEWVEGWLYKRVVHLNDCHMNVVVDAIEVYDGKSPLSIAYYTIDPATVGQFTGLTDKNGKRIFEGDIVCVDDSVWANNQWEPKQFICAIVFHERDARFTGIGKQRPREWLYNWNAKSYEVIGNIHDNPELIGGADVKDT